MKYRLTCLTPVLIGDGGKLSPIDYMVWKNQVNVLDQPRIFRLLSKGPRLDNYLKQIGRADKLEFAAWGGFAQNYADRRIPFEDAAYTQYWERLPSEHLHIPTFIASHAGPFLPGSALKGALRTALLAARASESPAGEIASRTANDKPVRNPGGVLEERYVGGSRQSRMKTIAVSDSAPVPVESLMIFLLRVAALDKKPGGGLCLRWKTWPGGSVAAGQTEASTPIFVEMATPGTAFEGSWRENQYYQRPEVAKALRWRDPLTSGTLLQAANSFARKQLLMHQRYAEVAGLDELHQGISVLLKRLDEVRGETACLVSLGWGGGFLSKSSVPDPSQETYKELLGQTPAYSRTIRSGLPFPKTRRIVFLANRPAALPGWALLELL